MSSLLKNVSAERIYEILLRLKDVGREDLIKRFRDAVSEKRRLAAYLTSVELTRRGVPPCFRSLHRYQDSDSVNQRSDLVIGDLTWLRHWYPEHANVVRYRRGKLIFDGSDTVFLREAEFAFYEGRRPAWKLVQSLSLSEDQQWECAYLRSTPISREAIETRRLSKRAFLAIRNDIDKVRRTVTFTDEDADHAVARRHALWECSRMVQSYSPTEIACRYEQLTGSSITRQTVGKQLQKMRLALRGMDVSSQTEDDMTRGRGVSFSNRRLD